MTDWNRQKADIDNGVICNIMWVKFVMMMHYSLDSNEIDS